MSDYAPEPTEDPDHEKWDSLYLGEEPHWAGTHDYDPRWDYSDELRPEWENHPLMQIAKERLRAHVGEHGRVFTADLGAHNGVGMFIHGTGGAPVILFDPYVHEADLDQHEAEEQATRTIDHEYRHALQEQDAEGEPHYDEDDAENWTPSSGAKPSAHQGAVPEDFKALLDPGKDTTPIKGPITYLWVYDPQENKVTLTDNESRHPAHRITHREFAQEVTHPSTIRGFAYKIRGGWRITNREHQEVEDPYVVKLVLHALHGQP